jgi:Holliday junction resolvase RusA-like endonuclease
MNANVFIEGVPYGQWKVKGDTRAPSVWTDTIIQQTRNLSKVKNPCLMSVIFVLPENKFPVDLPYGPDLDNLLKRLCDALNETVFSEVEGQDSAMVYLIGAKRKASQGESIGARVIINEFDSKYHVSERAICHLLPELEFPNILTSLESDYEVIEKAHDSIHEFMYIVGLCLPINAKVSWHSRSAFLICHWEVFHQLHRSLFEALSGYYNTAYVILRSALELLIKGAFWECLAHESFRDKATLLQKAKGKRRSVKDWIDSLIEAESSVKNVLEDTSAAIFDKTAILFDDQEFQREFVTMPSFALQVRQLIEWQIVDIPSPYNILYENFYRDLCRDVHVVPDATDVGRRLVSQRDFMEIEVMPEQLTAYLKRLHELVDVGTLLELNLLKDWIELGGKHALRKRLDILKDLNLKYSLRKLETLI